MLLLCHAMQQRVKWTPGLKSRLFFHCAEYLPYLQEGHISMGWALETFSKSPCNPKPPGFKLCELERQAFECTKSCDYLFKNACTVFDLWPGQNTINMGSYIYIYIVLLNPCRVKELPPKSSNIHLICIDVKLQTPWQMLDVSFASLL